MVVRGGRREGAGRLVVDDFKVGSRGVCYVLDLYATRAFIWGRRRGYRVGVPRRDRSL